MIKSQGKNIKALSFLTHVEVFELQSALGDPLAGEGGGGVHVDLDVVDVDVGVGAHPDPHEVGVGSVVGGGPGDGEHGGQLDHIAGHLVTANQSSVLSVSTNQRRVYYREAGVPCSSDGGQPPEPALFQLKRQDFKNLTRPAFNNVKLKPKDWCFVFD